MREAMSGQSSRRPTPDLESKPSEEFHPQWRPGPPGELPVRSAHGAGEESHVARFGGVGAVFGPAPQKAVRLIDGRKGLQPAPQLDVLHRCMGRKGRLDMPDPSTTGKALSYGTCPATTSGHERDEVRSKISDALAMEPTVLPEET